MTLNFGLRWDFERPWIERYNRMTSNYDLTFVSPISGAVQANYAAILANGASDPIIQQLAQIAPASSFKVHGAQLFAGVNGQPRTATREDWREFQPRVGFAYRFKPNTVVRCGFGRFVQTSDLEGGQNGFSRFTPIISTQDSFVTPYDTLASPYRNGILEPTGSSLGPLTNLGQGADWLNQDPGRPHQWVYSVQLEQEWKGWLFDISYNHERTYGIYWGLNQNNPNFDPWRQLRSPHFKPDGTPMDKLLWDELVPNPFRNVPFVTGGLATNDKVSFAQLILPNPLGTGFRDANPWGKTQWDGMEAKVEHRIKKDLSLKSALTWSKLFEDTAFWGPEISGPIPEHKLGGEDRPWRFSTASVWYLPVGRGKRFLSKGHGVLNGLLGGWEFAGQYTVQSGLPIVLGADSFYDGQDFAFPRGTRNLDKWFDTSHFLPFPNRNTDISNYPAWTGIQNMPGYGCTIPQGANFKNCVFNDWANFVRRYPTRWAHAREDRTNEVNLAVYKNFAIKEGVKLQLRFETFNTLNHPRFGGPNTNPGAANFGRVQPAQENIARLVELAGKLYF